MFREFIKPAFMKIYGYYKSHGVQVIAHHSDSYAATLVPDMIDMGIDIWQGVMTSNNVPELIRKNCGERNSERINSILTDLIENSAGGVLKMSDRMQKTFDFFHAFMYSDVYTNPRAKSEESKVEGILSRLYDYYTAHPDALPEDFRGIIEHEGTERAATDYMEKYGELFIPFAWTVK